MARGSLTHTYHYVYNDGKIVAGPFSDAQKNIAEETCSGDPSLYVVTSHYRLKTAEEKAKINELKKRLETPKKPVGKIDKKKVFRIMDLRSGEFIFTTHIMADAVAQLKKWLDEDVAVYRNIRQIQGYSGPLMTLRTRKSLRSKYYKTFNF